MPLDESDSFDTGRDRGVLSEADRQFLLDRDGYEEEYSRQARNHRVNEIKERTRNAIRDFELLLDHLNPEEVADIFDGFDDDSPGTVAWPPSAKSMLALCIVSFYDRGIDHPDKLTDMLVEDSIKKALEARGRELDSYQHLSFNRQASIEELQRRFEEGHALTYEQFQRLQREGATVDLTNTVTVARTQPGEMSGGEDE